jgi:hypothetical protein
MEVRTVNNAVMAMLAGPIKTWVDFKECAILVSLY